MIEVQSGGRSAREEAVLFAFDDHSIPFTAGVRLQLVPGKSPGVKNPVVVGKGKPGDPDDLAVRYYGAVARVEDELRMWYEAKGSRDEPGQGNQRRLCYAVSRDGLHWEKPKLGLVSYNGSRANNIVDLFGGRSVMAASPVIYDPEDTDASRRFKMVFESEVYGNCIAVAWSPDGLRWTVPEWNPVAPMLEQAGLMRFNGVYYVNGQGGRHFGQGRKLVTFASYDFRTWLHASCLGFRRDNVPPRPMGSEWNTVEEVHLGAGVWNRGNVVVGIYGMWHGHPTSDRNLVTMDLGLVVSSDGLHYREPIPDFRMVPSYEEPGWTPGTGPALMQGQGMHNVGDRTMFWYELWRDGDVRLASWERDRLGFLQMYDYPRRPAWLPPGQQFVDVEPHVVTCPIRTAGALPRFSVNVDGVGEHAALKAELLSEQLQPVAGCSGADASELRSSGLRQSIEWRKGATPVPEAVRLKLTFSGQRPELPKLYAIYVGG